MTYIAIILGAYVLLQIGFWLGVTVERDRNKKQQV